ncbi:hypothetical protein Z517_05922 [Fonsecaea pedrosoi CBS 271.37]|uniref:non-specific serine/threonine protein kinase n=1 Tax=Fonsecaea pedrosoi CBS 271.37 TaxID=1442368 RepID=A0A0D2GLB9_9EURO|nr:uncharacterized protein Z517_05922 [Fonsecaea pedrosoi CBS 271.37]KIW79310.1 hypothetical protein Z517_05922 [Fonsecaea pedrosoi CBS 271.37]
MNALCHFTRHRILLHVSRVYHCEIESESLERYRPGGYRPVNVGDTFCSRRYCVVQKLGWGGYATVWLAYDSVFCRLAALKVVVSEISAAGNNEVPILKRLASLPEENEQGRRHLRKLTDHFFHESPNGRHQCLVFDVDGVSAPTLAARSGNGVRLPGRLAWQVSKQITLALDCLRSNGIAHGDLYTSNTLVSHGEGQFSNPASLKHLNPPVQADITALPGHQLTKSVPRHIVEPAATFPLPSIDGPIHTRFIDFEQAFLHTDQQPLAKVRTPLVFRAPETLLDTTWDLRIDIWSLGCTIFELVTGQSSFDNFMPRKAPLVLEWIAMFGDVPEQWRSQAQVVVGECRDEIEGGSLSSWLGEVYFGNRSTPERKAEFTQDDIKRLADLLSRMMCYLPENRMSTQYVLKHEWFAKNPLDG